MTPTLVLMPCLFLRCASNWLFRSSMDFAIWDDQCIALVTWSSMLPAGALMPDHTFLLCTPRDRQDQLPAPFGNIALFSCSGRKQRVLRLTFHCTHFFAHSVHGLCFSNAVPECSTAASWQPEVVQNWAKPHKTPSIAIPYLGTRGTCSS